jgi:hypothetical protein
VFGVCFRWGEATSIKNGLINSKYGSMINYWIVRAEEIIEKEVVLIKNSGETRMWFDRMSSSIPIIYPTIKPSRPEDFTPRIGTAHHLRLTRHGIEAVLKSQRRYQRLDFYVLHDKINQPKEPFWVVFYKN